MQFSEPIHILGDSPARYCPTDEWIFPTVISTERLAPRPSSKWYMYYSPHDAPGGICLASADDLAGPWVEHPANPLIGNDWPGHYRVSHVASPHALWVPELGKLLLWFHGENDTTRWAWSHDGICFEYGGVAIQPGDGPALHERSYARVFPAPQPDATQRYVMLYMGRPDERRHIYVARSGDAMRWRSDPEPLIVPHESLGLNTSAGWLTRRAGRWQVLHHVGRFIGDPSRFNLSGNFYATDVSPDLESAGPTRLFYASEEGYPDFGRVADVQLVTHGGRTWMFYIGGRRLRGRIYARQLLDETDR